MEKWIELDAKISKHAKDLIQKYASGLFKNATLEFYGIKTAKIKELISVELPVVEVGGSTSDYVFLLEDDSYLHFEFETGYNKNAIVRFAGYDLRLFERDGRLVNTVIIYTADVKKAPPALNIGSLVYSPSVILMADYDGNAIYAELGAKIKTGQELSDTDMLNLIFLPLMRNTMPRRELAAKSIGLAQTIPDTTKRNACIAATFAFASRYLSDSESKNLLEVLKMPDLVVMLLEDAVRKEKKKYETEITEIAKKMLKRGMSADAVVEDTGLEETAVERLQAEISKDV
jgi:hypothetical protein